MAIEYIKTEATRFFSFLRGQVEETREAAAADLAALEADLRRKGLVKTNGTKSRGKLLYSDLKGEELDRFRNET